MECADTGHYEDGSSCPTCGTQIRNLGFREAIDIRNAKSKLGRIANLQEKIDSGDKKILVSDKMSDDEIQAEIYQDMLNLAMHEAGTKWMRAGTLLSFNSTDQMLGAGFKMLVDQNKILIRQNELILRALKKREAVEAQV